MKHIPNVKVGRPRKYDSPEELLKAGEAYFQDAAAEEQPTSYAGLALALGFTTRDALTNYEGYGEEFYSAIKQLKLRVENDTARIALSKPNQAGAIFMLKNYGYRDDQHHELTGAGGGNILVQHVCEYVKPNDPTEGGEGSGS